MMSCFQARFLPRFSVKSRIFQIDIMQITRDFTLFLSSGYLKIISAVFEDFKVNCDVFEA